MRFVVVLILSIFPIAECEYEEDAEELISMFDSMADTPLSNDIGKLHRFKEELSQFSKKLVPFAESFAESLKKEKPLDARFYNMTTHILNTIKGAARHSVDFPFDVHFRIESALDKIETVSLGYSQQYFKEMCFKEHGRIERAIEKIVGTSCLQTSFSPKTASILFELINCFKFANYTLSKKRGILESEQNRFNELYAALYFHLERNKEFDLSDGKLHAFITEKKEIAYENKVKLLEDLLQFFGINKYRLPTSPCLPLALFLESHFDRDNLLLLGDIIMNDIFATKFITHMCANITNYGNPKAAEAYVTAADKELGPIYSALTEWLDSLMESTWPETETELIKGFMKEASGGRQVKETADEYQRIANMVQDKMKSIGHPRNFRQFMVTQEYPVAVENPNFYYNCKENRCSRAVTDGAQCITLRNPKDKNGLETTEYNNFANFTERITPKLMDVLEKGYQNVPEVVNHFDHDHNVSLTTFVNHSSYIGFHKNQYFGNCRIFYGYKSEEEENSSFLRFFSYHKDRSLFSKCHDWLFFMGF